MKNNKIGTVFLASMLALAGLGVSYAGFFDEITVFGTVEAATVTMVIDEYSGTWVYKNLATGLEVITHVPFEFGDVIGEIEVHNGIEYLFVAYARAYEGAGGADDPDVIMEWNNIFPCIDFTANIVVKYTGSIPAHVGLFGYQWSGDLEQYSTIKADGEIITLPFYPVQMHSNDELLIEVTIHIPQDNTLQYKSGEFWFKIYAIQWYDPCEYNPFPGPKTINIPTTCSMVVSRTGTSYFQTTIDDFDPEGDYLPYVEEGETYKGWCIDFAQFITPGHLYTGVQMYSTYPGDEAWLPGQLDSVAWQRINYIINHKATTGFGGRQQWECVTWAIWYFVNGGSHPVVTQGLPYTYPGNIQAVENMIADAIAHPYYVPGEGELVGVIMYKPGTVQITIIEVDP